MTVLVTGAAGFIGHALVTRLLAEPGCPALTLIDQAPCPPAFERAGIRYLAGSIADPALLQEALQAPPDTVFHLASVPGGRAEQDYRLGRTVNLDATLALLEQLADARPAKPPVVVFASSIAVFGGPLPDPVPEDVLPRPLLSYGAQKLIGEVLVADLSRRGWINGRSIRISGIVARPATPPGQAAGAISIFFSDLIRDLPRGLPVRVPMRPEATTWLMSVERCVDNLLHAARMPTPGPGPRAWTPPPLHVTMAALVAAIGRHHGADLTGLVTYAPDARIEAAFGASPPLLCPQAEAAGFLSDGSLAALVARASVT